MKSLSRIFLEILLSFLVVFLDLVAHATVFGEIENSGEDQVVESRKNSILVLRVLEFAPYLRYTWDRSHVLYITRFGSCCS